MRQKLNQKIKLNNLPVLVSEVPTVGFTSSVRIKNDEGVVWAGYCLYKNNSFFVERDPLTKEWIGQ